ncbi:MAG TPA: ABC transporter substrate-binding protein [Chloroflexota bacterium]|nr:ABC transporter substrate-binding protein [Chloroflexota bacterium]
MKQPVLRPLLTVLSGVLLSLSVACSAPAPGAAAPGPAAPAAASAASPAPAAAANPYAPLPGTPLEAIRVGVCAVSGGFIQLYTALEGGVFPRYGLEVELVTIRGSGAALAALSSNEIQFLYCAADATIPGLASGADAKIVAAPLVGVPYLFITRPEIHSFADLRGKAVGIPRPGDLADKLSRLALQRHGLVPNQDVAIRPVGGSQPERYQAMLANIVQGNVLTPPFDAQARKDGMRILYDLADLGLPFVYSSVHTSNRLLRENPRLVERFVAAMAEAVVFTERNPAVAREALRKVLDVEEAAVLDAAYEAYARKLINRRLRIPLDAVAASIEDAREAGTNVVVGGAEEIATNAFVDELERQGVFERLLS